jgi:hypothetical protein
MRYQKVYIYCPRGRKETRRQKQLETAVPGNPFWSQK